MKIPMFQLINLAIILVVLFFLIKYMYDLFFGNGYEPVHWEKARKSGKIPPRLLKIKRNYPDKIRFFNFWLQVDRLQRERVPGCFAEAGVYKGESAAALHHMDPSRMFHLFDTFTGFPAADLIGESGEAATYSPRNFADTTTEQVLLTIEGNGNLILHPGHIPETFETVKDLDFALVSLDADLYKPTRAALEFFYKRLNRGGVIFVHDYNEKWPGIIRAVDEFLLTVPEKPALLPDMDGTILIVKS
jgi:O-methyltransferase